MNEQNLCLASREHDDLVAEYGGQLQLVSQTGLRHAEGISEVPCRGLGSWTREKGKKREH